MSYGQTKRGRKKNQKTGGLGAITFQTLVKLVFCGEATDKLLYRTQFNIPYVLLQAAKSKLDVPKKNKKQLSLRMYIMYIMVSLIQNTISMSYINPVVCETFVEK